MAILLSAAIAVIYFALMTDFLDSVHTTMDSLLKSGFYDVASSVIVVAVVLVLVSLTLSVRLRLVVAMTLSAWMSYNADAFACITTFSDRVSIATDALVKSDLWQNIFATAAIASVLIFNILRPQQTPLQQPIAAPKARPNKSPPRRSVSPGGKKREIDLNTRAVPFASRAVRQQHGGTCYAHAIATVVRATIERNAIKRDQARREASYVPSSEHLRNRLVDRYGVDGASVQAALRWCCGEYGLKFEALSSERDAHRTLKNGRPLVATMVLSEEDWVSRRPLRPDPNTLTHAVSLLCIPIRSTHLHKTSCPLPAHSMHHRAHVHRDRRWSHAQTVRRLSRLSVRVLRWMRRCIGPHARLLPADAAGGVPAQAGGCDVELSRRLRQRLPPRRVRARSGDHPVHG